LVNNAGIYEYLPLEVITQEHFHKHFDLNVLGLYQFFMRLHRIRPPLAPLNKGGTRFFSKSPFLRGI
jgi:NAD(P)-dependent dehydrogenase (short-subunit alcohol dehydrogenase family)